MRLISLFRLHLVAEKQAKYFHECFFRVALLLGRYRNPQDSACSESPGAPGRPISLGWWTRVEEAICPYSPEIKGVGRNVKKKKKWSPANEAEINATYIYQSVRSSMNLTIRILQSLLKLSTQYFDLYFQN